MEVLSGLEAVKAQAGEYWRQIDQMGYIDDFINFGSLPFTLNDVSEFSKRQRVDSMLRESLSEDIEATNRFEAATKNLFPSLLFLLASSDAVSVGKLAGHLGLN